MNVITIQPHPACPGHTLLHAVKGEKCKLVYAASFPAGSDRIEFRETSAAMRMFPDSAELHFKVFGMRSGKDGKVCYLKKHIHRVDGVVSEQAVDKRARTSSPDADADSTSTPTGKKGKEPARKRTTAPAHEPDSSAGGTAILPLPGEGPTSGIPTTGRKTRQKKATTAAEPEGAPSDAAKKREAGRKKYQSFVKKFKSANPGATKDQIRAAWAEKKASS